MNSWEAHFISLMISFWRPHTLIQILSTKVFYTLIRCIISHWRWAFNHTTKLLSVCHLRILCWTQDIFIININQGTLCSLVILMLIWCWMISTLCLHKDHVVLKTSVTVHGIEFKIIFLDNTWVVVLKEWGGYFTNHISLYCGLVRQSIFESKCVTTLYKWWNVLKVKVPWTISSLVIIFLALIFLHFLSSSAILSITKQFWRDLVDSTLSVPWPNNGWFLIPWRQYVWLINHFHYLRSVIDNSLSWVWIKYLEELILLLPWGLLQFLILSPLLRSVNHTVRCMLLLIIFSLVHLWTSSNSDPQFRFDLFVIISIITSELVLTITAKLAIVIIRVCYELFLLLLLLIYCLAIEVFFFSMLMVICSVDQLGWSFIITCELIFYSRILSHNTSYCTWIGVLTVVVSVNTRGANNKVRVANYIS